MYACMLSCFSHVRLSLTLWTIACQIPLSMGILQAGILEWIVMSSSRGPSPPKDQTQIYVSCFDSQVLYHQHHLVSSQYVYVIEYFTSIQFSSVALLYIFILDYFSQFYFLNQSHNFLTQCICLVTSQRTNTYGGMKRKIKFLCVKGVNDIISGMRVHQKRYFQRDLVP